MGTIIKGAAIGVVGTALLAIAIWLTVAYTGAYNVSAADQHFDVVRWTFDTTRRRSIANRADEIAPPETLTDEMIAEGASFYAETCVHCHGAPGEEQEDWARGMRPMPPELMKAATEWELAEIQWIVTHGIKMTGMPAFGEHHSQDEIASIAAFVSKLPGLTPEDYASLSGSGHEEPSHAGESGDAAHSEGGGSEGSGAEGQDEPSTDAEAPREEAGPAPEITPPAEAPEVE